MLSNLKKLAELTKAPTQLLDVSTIKENLSGLTKAPTQLLDVSTIKDNLPGFTKAPRQLLDMSAIKENLSSGLFNVMNESYEQRKIDSQNSDYTVKDINKIIESYSRKNMVIAATCAMIPGPFGILSSVPELLLSLKNQMNMIYDIGCATGKENFISKDILLDIPIFVFGGTVNFPKVPTDRNALKESAESILIEKSILLGESIIKRTVKKSIVQFLPVAGPILMGTWAKITTSKISKGTLNFFDDQQTFANLIKPAENEDIKCQLQIEKIKGLVNLIESNNQIDDKQIELIGTIIENSDIKSAEKEFYLKESLKTNSNFKLNKKLLKTYEEEEELLMELVVMANRSGNIDELEKAYIYKVGGELEIATSFIDELF